MECSLNETLPTQESQSTIKIEELGSVNVAAHQSQYDADMDQVQQLIVREVMGDIVTACQLIDIPAGMSIQYKDTVGSSGWRWRQMRLSPSLTKQTCVLLKDYCPYFVVLYFTANHLNLRSEQLNFLQSNCQKCLNKLNCKVMIIL